MRPQKMKAGPGLAELLYTVLIVGLICLFIFSEQPFEQGESRLHRRQLPEGGRNGGRLSKKHESVAFDPLVAHVELRREDRKWEEEYWTRQYRSWANQAQQWISHPNLGHHPPPEQMYAVGPPAREAEPQPDPWNNFNDSDYGEYYAGKEYLNTDDFNITRRLEVLFPQIDSNPQNGLVSLGELEHWQEMSALRVTHHRTDRDVEVHDMDGDGLITFSEFLPHITPADEDENYMEVGGAGWWKEQFENADEDGNGVLNRTEFHEFLHPEDSRVERIHLWIIRQELRGRSMAHEFRLTWQDFHENVFDAIRDYGAEESAPHLAHLNPYRDMEARKKILSRAKFDELDTNKDGFITEEEAEPFVNILRPGELYFARVQAGQLIEQADDDRDSQLSLSEMLTHPFVFYNTAYDHGDHAYSHDEFR